MTLFQPVELPFRGRTYTLAAKRIMATIGEIEQVVTLLELSRIHQRGGAPVGLISAAYAIALQGAGVKVTPEDVFAEMYTASESASAVDQALHGLLALMLPPAALRSQEGQPRGNAPAAAAGTEAS